MRSYDPMRADLSGVQATLDKVWSHLDSLPLGSISRSGSRPMDYVYQWLFALVCILESRKNAKKKSAFVTLSRKWVFIPKNMNCRIQAVNMFHCRRPIRSCTHCMRYLLLKIYFCLSFYFVFTKHQPVFLFWNSWIDFSASLAGTEARREIGVAWIDWVWPFFGSPSRDTKLTKIEKAIDAMKHSLTIICVEVLFFGLCYLIWVGMPLLFK